MTANYIREYYPEIKKARVVGMNSIKKQLAAVGIASVGAEDIEEFDKVGQMDIDHWFETYKLDPEVKAVVVGLDNRFTYAKLCLASLYL